ncbi:MAG: thioredoxin domain-containing protein [Bacteroidales bacterium]|nr:thioredoxin domain-containing protein [Bacteroidales bacterium]
MPNRLIHESSPYLQQHAHNPVDWYPYGNEAFEAAVAGNKPLLISIGYSACHWCHVMEHESFSQAEVAAFMNRNFICIKVDREERPDVDQVYMSAVQLLNGNGGWPLNCFALPDGRPFWGGTYFRPEQWLDVLGQISRLYTEHHHELVEQSERIRQGIAASGLVELPEKHDNISQELVDESFAQLSWSFDTELGGLRGAPKFPMPVVWDFVLTYQRITRNAEALAQLNTTLQRMARGGIFDQIGGGFARYSTDNHWKVPHFEKMLYDNAQLTALYSRAWSLTGNVFYKEILEKTIGFVFRELRSPEGLFYSALDADSEGREGLFYLWTREQIREELPEYADLLCRYWGVDAGGLWEKGQSILLRPSDDAEFASREHLSEAELAQLVSMAGRKLLNARDKRVRPGLDNKIILSWNALMVKSLAEAYIATGNQTWLDAALSAATLLSDRFFDDQGMLKRSLKRDGAAIDALLDDYVFLADAYLRLYLATFDESWVLRADELVKKMQPLFYHAETGFFWYSPEGIQRTETKAAVARMMLTTDGVEPSANAVMAGVLLELGHLTDNHEYIDRGSRMVDCMHRQFLAYPSAYAAWAAQAAIMANGITTVVFTGPDALRFAGIVRSRTLPGVVLAAAETGSVLPVFNHRFETGSNRIYKCRLNVCEPPVSSVVDLIL